MNNLERPYSDRAGKMRRSVIRELLKVAQDPEIISFAGRTAKSKFLSIGGVAESRTIHFERPHGKTALQYETTQGLKELREAIAERAYKDGIETTADNIVITSGSQQALDTIGKLFLNPGDTALVGLPTYLGGINAFRAYENNLTGIPLDKDGMRVDILEETIKKLLKDDIIPKFIYVVPTFQNPQEL